MLLNCGVGENLRVPWTARRSNQSLLKEINPEYSLEGLMLKLKVQYFGHLMWRTDSFEKTLMLGKIKGGRRRGWQRMRWLDGITDSMASLTRWTWVWAGSGSWWWTGKPGVLQSMGSQRAGHGWVTGLNWTMMYRSRHSVIQKTSRLSKSILNKYPGISFWINLHLYIATWFWIDSSALANILNITKPTRWEGIGFSYLILTSYTFWVSFRKTQN